MARYRRWVFETNATKDEFLRHFARALGRAGLSVGPAKTFDLALAGGGARGWVKVLHHPDGVDLVFKEKGGLFTNAGVLEAAVLQAGRDAQLRVLGREPSEGALP